MIVILLVCLIGMAYVLFGQNVPVGEEYVDDNLLSPNFVQTRKTRTVQNILNSLELKFIDYNIYKNLRGGVDLPEVKDSEIGNTQPFQIIEFNPQSF